MTVTFSVTMLLSMRMFDSTSANVREKETMYNKIAEIDRDLCVGCTICKRTCQFEAISGALKQVHEVNEACTGCGECVKKCPKKAITLKVRKHPRDANAKVGTTPVEAAVPKA